jgi:16S rRNA processing protein RimM
MNKRICIAKIVNVHGIKGEVKIKTYTISDNDIFTFKAIYDEENNLYNIKKSGVSKGCIIARINDLKDRNESTKLVGKELFIEREELPEINDEEFYHSDLIGLDIVDLDRKRLGSVKAIHNFGNSDILEIEFTKSVNNNLFPFTREIFPEINIKENYVVFKQNM